MDKFKLVSKYKPTGDQPQAIEALTDGINKGFSEQTLLGVTRFGSQQNSRRPALLGIQRILP